MKYRVTIPIAGSITIFVDGPDGATRDELFDAAIDEYCQGNNGEVEWEFFRKIVSGNLLHVPQNEVEVEPLGD